MRICVCVKIVPLHGLPLRIDADDRRLDRSGAAEIGPNDVHAVETALGLRGKELDEVIVLAMAPAAAAERLRPVLAMGADRAVVIADERLAGSDLLVTSRVLATALRAQKPDLVVFGAQSRDGGGAMLASAVAERLELPVLSAVQDLQVRAPFASGWRRTADADVQLQAPLPCVVGLSGATEPASTPSFRDAIEARRKPLEIVDATSLGLSVEQLGAPGSRSTVTGLRAAPKAQRSGEVIRDEGQAARWLLDFLVQRGLV